jgi:DNA-binding NarL/FixJ family response regulator
MNKLKLLVVDDHAILRAGLRLLINCQPDMEVLDEASDSSTALQKVAESVFDVVIMDLSMPGGNTSKAIEAIRRKSPRTRVLVLSMYDDPAYLVAVMTAGASGYVLKRSADSDLLSAIRTVHRGESFIDPTIAHNVVQRTVLKRAAAHTAEPGKARHILSQRERQVLKLVADGHTNQEVADRLFLSVKTVETHRARLMRKLGLSTRADLIRYARESGVQTGEGTGADHGNQPAI